MRIIGGELRRRLLASPPPGATTRPLPDMVKQALFNLLRGHFEGVDVYDAFAGVGGFGLEAISRGARRAVMVERDKRVAAVLEANARTLGVLDKCEVITADALGPMALARCPSPVHIALLDPPYDLVREAQTWPRVKAACEGVLAKLTDTGFLVLRTPWPCTHEGVEVDLRLAGGVGPETHVYRHTALNLYMRARAENASADQSPAHQDPGAS